MTLHAFTPRPRHQVVLPPPPATFDHEIDRFINAWREQEVAAMVRGDMAGARDCRLRIGALEQVRLFGG